MDYIVRAFLMFYKPCLWQVEVGSLYILRRWFEVTLYYEAQLLSLESSGCLRWCEDCPRFSEAQLWQAVMFAILVVVWSNCTRPGLPGFWGLCHRQLCYSALLQKHCVTDSCVISHSYRNTVSPTAVSYRPPTETLCHQQLCHIALLVLQKPGLQV